MLSILLFSVLAEASVLQGNWQTSCSQNMIREEVFQGANVSLFEKNFQEALCAIPSLEIENAGSFILDASILPAYHSIDFQFSAVYLTLHQAEIVNLYNQQNICGHRDWSLHERKEITGLACDFWGTGTPFPVPRKGDFRFGIYELHGNQLYFGALTPVNNGLSAIARPSTLDPQPYEKEN